MLEKIKTENLSVGMYVVCSATGFPNLPTNISNNYISSKENISAILKLSIKEVLIDSSKSSCQPQFPKTSYSEEILFARKAYNDALICIHDIYDIIKNKGQIQIEKYGEKIDPLLDSIERNNSVTASLTVLARTDRYLFTHSLNTAILSAILGRHMGLCREEIKELSISAILMNAGQVWMNEDLFKKNGKLSINEFAKIKKHPQSGFEYLTDQKEIPENILKAVIQHHEKYDGSGYPHGLSGNNISKYARILSICDSYDAMTSDRPYREALTPNMAIKHLYTMTDTSFHPRYLENFIKCIGIYPVGCFVKLSDKRYGVVVSNTPKAPLLPQVKVVFNSRFRAIHPEFVDLASHSSKNSGKSLEIIECIHPKTFKLELSRFLR
ncbi:HD-GYP domain-containing protein [Maridesulfovibrio zosterae]|uniref:HD-GYP domain-containing protein n=1 Tax=Maridesulfovibrio zosterae TaxID=82171 RepID=UPI0004206EE3|nr:HD-GYP domain-containing protein [Maridesulfovibrio zosterae]